jgi:3-methyladenine DNA glycosylase AlkD
LSNVGNIRREFRSLGNPAIAEYSQRFFKTGVGEYGEGDKFLGIRVPVVRKAVQEHKEISEKEVRVFLQSKYHEERLFAALLLVDQFKRGTDSDKERIYHFYLDNTRYINNWDIVDGSAHLIVGPYLEHRDRKVIYDLSKSGDLWERRIAIMSTYHYIKHLDFKDTLIIATTLRNDPEDLIHKAVGWMLREVGNRDLKTEEAFLRRHYKKMPRTMLRYAIEKFPEKKRKHYLHGRI